MRVLALCHGRKHGIPEGREGKGVRFTTVDVDPTALPHYVADLMLPDAFDEYPLKDRFDITDFLHGLIWDDFALWNNVVSALRKDGNGFAVMQMCANTLTRWHRSHHARHRVKSSYKSYTPLDNSTDTCTPEEQNAAYVDFITRVTNPRRRYAGGQVQLVPVPLVNAPPHVRRYVGEATTEVAVFRVVSHSRRARKTRTRIDAENRSVLRETECFVNGLVECVLRADLDTLRFRLESPHYPLSENDVFRLFTAAIKTCRDDVCHQVLGMYSDVIPGMVGDLLDETAKSMMTSFGHDLRSFQALVRVHTSLWDCYVKGQECEGSLRYIHVDNVRRLVRENEKKY
jgi:hypothetical protein